MLIKSLIIRPGGSVVSFGPHQTPEEVAYRFTGPVAGPHVCDVTDEDHAAHLLALEPPAFVLAEVPAGADESEKLESAAEERKEAMRAYREAVGKNPSPKWSTEVIIEKTRAAAEAADDAEEREEVIRDYRDTVGEEPDPAWTTEEIVAKTTAFLDAADKAAG